MKDAILNFPGYRLKCNLRNIEWWRFQKENKTDQWVQINLNKRLARLKYKIDQNSTEPIVCKINKMICPHKPERHNNHQMDGCQKTELYTLHNGHCIPNEHLWIDKISKSSPK